jgi:hypothetical protein
MDDRTRSIADIYAQLSALESVATFLLAQHFQRNGGAPAAQAWFEGSIARAVGKEHELVSGRPQIREAGEYFAQQLTRTLSTMRTEIDSYLSTPHAPSRPASS